jgi:hypothetical protein
MQTLTTIISSSVSLALVLSVVVVVRKVEGGVP